VPKPSLLFLNVFLLATCGLVYELLAGTLASYVLGDSVTQFSVVIGLYLSAMGVGAWLSRHLEEPLAARFVDVELGVALFGGLSAPMLFLATSHVRLFPVLLYGIVAMVGMLVGLELPLLMRILEGRVQFKDLVSRIFTFDYLGSLAASLLFPLVCVPRLGLVRTAIVFGLLNALIALWCTSLLAQAIPPGKRLGLRLRACAVLAVLTFALAGAEAIVKHGEEQVYADEIVYAQTTPYQRLVVTKNRAGFQLFLNGNLQFSSADEYRYHEALVHPAHALAPEAREVLVLGGGDGLALREILKNPHLERVTLVDIDPAMTNLPLAYPPLAALNGHAFDDPRVRVVHDDAMAWLTREGPSLKAQLAIVDFPDPNHFALGKLYTTRFYRLLREALAPGAAVVVQASSPLFSREAYWCVVRTLEAAGFNALPYHAHVPSFGPWGYVLASTAPIDPPARLPAWLDGKLRFLDGPTLASLFVVPRDLAPVEVAVNRLDNQALVRYYENAWHRWQ
jgi:spermidine synthase